MTDTAMLSLSIITGCIAFVAGFFLRLSVHKKQKKNILKLKKEMGANNERILWLKERIESIQASV